MDIHGLLQKKLVLMQEILTLTENTPLTGDAEDAEKYIELIEKRESIMKGLSLIDQQIVKQDQTVGNEKLRKEAELIKNEIRSVVSQIISLDTEMAKAAPQITAGLKKRLKDINASKNISTAYHGVGYYSSYDDGTGFDKKK